MEQGVPSQAKAPLCYIVTVNGKYLEVVLHLATLNNIVFHFIKEESAGPDLLHGQQGGCDLLFEKMVVQRLSILVSDILCPPWRLVPLMESSLILASGASLV